MVIYGWKNLLDRAALARDPIAELVRIYKEANERATADPASARSVPRGAGETAGRRPGELRASGRNASRFRCRNSKRAYEILDIHYDIQRGESFYNDRLPAWSSACSSPESPRSAKARSVVFFRDIPELADKPCIIRKSDGGYNYATTDIATVDYRVKDLKARHGLVRRRRAADLAFQTDFRDRAPRRVHGRFPPHHFWQHSRRRPQADENALGRERAVA